MGYALDYYGRKQKCPVCEQYIKFGDDCITIEDKIYHSDCLLDTTMQDFLEIAKIKKFVA